MRTDPAARAWLFEGTDGSAGLKSGAIVIVFLFTGSCGDVKQSGKTRRLRLTDA